jgi:hypothetical protein
MVEGLQQKHALNHEYDYITIMERTSISCFSTTNHKRSYLRVIASSNLCPSSLCFGMCWYPSVCWHLKLHLVCSLVETNCHTTLSVKRASSAAFDPNRTIQETDEVGLALLTGRTTFWPQRFHAIGRCTLQSFVNRNNCHVQVTDMVKLHVVNPCVLP